MRSCIHGTFEEKGQGFDLTVPVGIAVGAVAGVPAPLVGAVDVGGGGSRKDQKSTDLKFLAPGVQVYAVQYRWVEFSWFSSKNLSTAELEKGNRWEVHLKLRCVKEDEDGDDEEEDIVDVKVSESLSISDLALGTSCECFELDNGYEILYVSD